MTMTERVVHRPLGVPAWPWFDVLVDGKIVRFWPQRHAITLANGEEVEWYVLSTDPPPATP